MPRVPVVDSNLFVSLLDIARNLADADGLRASARRLLDLALRLSGFPEGHVYSYDRNGGRLVALASTREAHAGASVSLDDVDDPLVQVALTGQPVVAAGQAVGQSRAYTLMALPLLAAGRVVGVLQLGGRQSAYLTESDVALLTLAANQMAGAVESARLYEEAVAERAKARAIVDACAEGILVVDAQHHITDANPALANLAGFAVEDLIGRTCTYLLGAQDQCGRSVCDVHCPLRGQGGTQQREVEATVRASGGREVPVVITYGCLRDRAGAVTGVVHTIRDVTAQRAAERAIVAEKRRAEEEQRRLQVVIDNLPEGVCIAYSGKIRRVIANRKAGELLGPPDCLLNGGDPADGCVLLTAAGQPFPASQLPLACSLRGEVCAGVQVGVRRADRTVATLLVNSAPLRDGDGTLVGAVAAFQDISDIKEVERMKDEFLAVASHELRTPITSIKGYAQMLARRLARRPDREEEDLRALHVIIRQIDRLILLVSQLLDVSRLQTGGFHLVAAPFDLAALALDVVERMRVTTDRHELRLEVGGPLPVVGDGSRIEQVLLNLIANAIRYSPEGGHIQLRVAAENGQAVVVVRDHGVGIPKEKLGRVFERFYQAHADALHNYGGMGLGLYVSNEIVTRHGGKIWVESKEGEGSTFYFSIPLAGPGIAAEGAEERGKGNG